jgi:hypothetical protein
MASVLRPVLRLMGRERCLLCGRFIFDGDDTTRPNGLGLTVHRHCYRRDVGLERNPDSPDEAETDDGESEDSPSW